mgnify:CR=1 FL=1
MLRYCGRLNRHTLFTNTPICEAHASRLTSLVQTKSNHMRIDHAQVEWCQERIRVGERDEHGVIGHWVTLVDLASGLVGITSVVTGDLERSVSQVELVDPGNESGSTSRCCCNVGVVGANSQTRVLPSQVEELAGEGKRLGAVACDTGCTGVSRMLGRVDIDTTHLFGDGGVAGVCDAAAGDLVGLGVVGREAVGIGLIVDEQRREVLPRETSGVFWTLADIRSKVGPCPRLGDTSLKPYWHRWKTEHLTERELLTRLGGDGLRQKLSSLARVEMVDKSPDT